ncbi:MAG: ferritin family protein [Spirochaetes bacterium]|nr:ferritin family protein [Spirochaetota bacterium]
MENKTMEDVIGKAITREEEAFAFYTNLLKTVDDATAKDALQFLADEEKKHRDFLVAYRDGKVGGEKLRLSEVVDYKIAQFIEAPDIEKDMQSRDVYLVASHRELNSYNFYKGLSEMQPDGEVKDMLLRMANEEMKHKEKVEYLYANTAFPQTQGG